jgi:hypothetical protein
MTCSILDVKENKNQGKKSNYQRFNGVRSLKRMAFLVHRNENKVIPFLHGKREMLQIDKFSNKNYWMQLINLTLTIYFLQVEGMLNYSFQIDKFIMIHWIESRSTLLT